MQLLIDENFAEKVIPADDSVRLLDQIVEEMDLSQLERAYNVRGRKPATEPSTMLKILLYANMEGIYSSRKIRTACQRDVNYMWLLNGTTAPSYHEIARFRSQRLSECAEGLFFQLVGRLEGYGEIKADIGKILRKLCEQKGIEIIEAEACPDHIHMLLSIPPKMSVSYAIGYLKGKSSLMIFDRHANLKYKYGNRHFWARGYYVDTVGRNKEAIKKYIQNQLKEDEMADQMTIKEYYDPFTGEEYQKRNSDKINPFTDRKKK